MVDKFTDKAEGAVDKARAPAKELSGDALDDQAKKAQGTIDQGKGDAKHEVAGGKSKVEEATDKITGN